MSDQAARDFQAQMTKAIYEAMNEFSFGSSFNFLKEVKGFKRGMMHVLLGDVHSGKSSVVRSIVLDFLENNPHKKIFWYLSEESVMEVQVQIAKNFDFDSNKCGDTLDRIEFVSEKEVGVRPNVNDLWKGFKSDCDLYILDNITTSVFYQDIRSQTSLALDLKSGAIESGKPFLVVAHTNNIPQNKRHIINVNDIRGSKTLSNIAEFFFVNQQVEINTSKHNFIKIDKHRSVDISRSFFRLTYNKARRAFDKDVAVDFDDFKRVLKDQNSLNS